MRQNIFLVVLLTLMGMCTSCVTQKNLTYFRTLQAEDADSINKAFELQQDPVLRIGDALLIQISALDEEAAIPYNMVAVVPSTGTQLNMTPIMLTYVVDEQGDIILPVLGRLHVEGMSKTELRDELTERLSKQIKDPLVTISLQNRKVTVMGEVRNPKQVPIPNGRLTILEALASAGDLTPYGKRNNILVTREVNGKMEIARLDLTSNDIFSSPYYFLQQNDVIYVSPNHVRVVNSQNVGLWLSVVSTLASAATVIVTVIQTTK